MYKVKFQVMLLAVNSVFTRSMEVDMVSLIPIRSFSIHISNFNSSDFVSRYLIIDLSKNINNILYLETIYKLFKLGMSDRVIVDYYGHSRRILSVCFGGMNVNR